MIMLEYKLEDHIEFSQKEYVDLSFALLHLTLVNLTFFIILPNTLIKIQG